MRRTFLYGLCLLSALPLSANTLLRRGTVLDSERNAAYVAAPRGNVEAIDLGSGRSLWQFDGAALPLALHGNLLVAQAEEKQPGRLRIVVLDARARGRQVMESVIALPSDVRALIKDEMRTTFRVTVDRDGEDFLVSWTFKERRVEGRRPGEPTPPRIVEGAARVELQSGRATGVQPIVPPAAAKNARWRSGKVLATAEGGRGGPVRLKRWDAATGDALPDLELSRDAVAVLPSADHTHLVAIERAGSGAPDEPEYRWAIFSVESGAPAGELRRSVSASPFIVRDGNVIFESRPHGFRSGGVWVEEPLKLRAVRLSTGAPVWDHALRDLEARGPLPPSR